MSNVIGKAEEDLALQKTVGDLEPGASIKDKFFDTDWYDTARIYNTSGDNIDLDDLLGWIMYQRNEVGLNNEDILDKLILELS